MEDMWIKMEDLQKKLKPYIAMLAGIFSDILLILSLLTAGSSLFILINEHRTGEPCFVLGYKTVMVSSGSMEDTFSKGDLVLIEEINGKEAVPGDILLFRKGESLVLHRYIGNDSERLSSGDEAYMITKGDNNNIEDIERLAPKNVYGRAIV